MRPYRDLGGTKCLARRTQCLRQISKCLLQTTHRESSKCPEQIANAPRPDTPIRRRREVRDGAVVIRKMMNLSSSFDHRVVDGMDAAQFIQAIRALLECPAMLFVE